MITYWIYSILQNKNNRQNDYFKKLLAGLYIMFIMFLILTVGFNLLRSVSLSRNYRLVETEIIIDRTNNKIILSDISKSCLISGYLIGETDERIANIATQKIKIEYFIFNTSTGELKKITQKQTFDKELQKIGISAPTKLNDMIGFIRIKHNIRYCFTNRWK